LEPTGIRCRTCSIAISRSFLVQPGEFRQLSFTASEMESGKDASAARLHVPGGFYHVTLRGNHREALFVGAADRTVLNDIVAELLERFRARLHAFCWVTITCMRSCKVADRPLGELMKRVAMRYSRYRHKDPRVLGGDQFLSRIPQVPYKPRSRLTLAELAVSICMSFRRQCRSDSIALIGPCTHADATRDCTAGNRCENCHPGGGCPRRRAPRLAPLQLCGSRCLLKCSQITSLASMCCEVRPTLMRLEY
jgi:hypothetical protein